MEWKKPSFQNLLFIYMKISLAKSAVEALFSSWKYKYMIMGAFWRLSSLKLLINASGLILRAALDWVAPEANSETRIQIQVIYLGSNLKKCW